MGKNSIRRDDEKAEDADFMKKYTPFAYTASEIADFRNYRFTVKTMQRISSGTIALTIGVTSDYRQPKLYGIVYIDNAGKKYARFYYRVYFAYKQYLQIINKQG